MDTKTREEYLSERRTNERHGDHAVILLHGLCGSVLEMGSIPKALKKINCTVVVMNIHNYSAALTDPANTPEWTDWCAIVENKILRLKEEFKTVSICGLSMGATLALAVAARSKELLSIVLLSPVLHYDGWGIPWYHKLMSVPYRLGYRNWL